MQTNQTQSLKYESIQFRAYVALIFKQSSEKPSWPYWVPDQNAYNLETSPLNDDWFHKILADLVDLLDWVHNCNLQSKALSLQLCESLVPILF